MEKENKSLIYEVAGWYGALAIMGAYALVSFEVITADTLLYLAVKG